MYFGVNVCVVIGAPRSTVQHSQGSEKCNQALNMEGKRNGPISARPPLVTKLVIGTAAHGLKLTEKAPLLILREAAGQNPSWRPIKRRDPKWADPPTHPGRGSRPSNEPSNAGRTAQRSCRPNGPEAPAGGRQTGSKESKYHFFF
ncbi:histone acetyltransferase of the GNAT family 2 [Striga asiatica]|uniref:Histone acetyltransferase of the GNAT family 2 n=1 Tax=Striga asiatica TaxID=4170 RepID=A0A5A7PG70_STRAF|nr:histone acetyltransferase of the GNAT family 2 [Striga asiatica]